MSVKINYSNKSSDKISPNTVLFVNEKFETKGLKKFISSSGCRAGIGQVSGG